MRKEVSFQSQYTDDVPTEWQSRACSIANVKMVLESMGVVAPSMKELITEAESISGGFGPRGWTHDALVFVLHNHGVHAYKEEFRSRDEAIADRLVRDGLKKIEQHVVNKAPVVASLQKENGSYHTIVIVGFLDGDIFYHDPEVGPDQKMLTNEFLKRWKKMVIFPY